MDIQDNAFGLFSLKIYEVRGLSLTKGNCHNLLVGSTVDS